MHMQMYYFFTWPVDLELLNLCFLWNVLHSGLSCIWEAEHSDHLTAVNEQMHGSRVSPPSDWQLPAKTSCRVNLRYQQSSSTCLVSLTFMFASLLWLKTLILKLIKTILGEKNLNLKCWWLQNVFFQTENLLLNTLSVEVLLMVVSVLFCGCSKMKNSGTNFPPPACVKVVILTTAHVRAGRYIVFCFFCFFF